MIIGSIQRISKMIQIKIILVAMINQSHQAKRFCIAQTYSGFCLRTIHVHILDNGEYFGHHKTFIKKSVKNINIIIFIII